MPYTLQSFKNDTLSSDITDSATSLTLTTGSFGTPTGEQMLVVDYDVASKREIIKCTIDGTAVTGITRAQDGTSAVAHSSGAKVIMAFVPTHFEYLKDLASDALGDGWQDPSETFAYASGTTITVPAGALTKYSVGDKLKMNQSIPLTSYWNMDGNSSDTKGSNNGTDTNMSYTATGTKFVQHAVFNGTTSKIVVADHATLKPTGAFTAGCWVKTAVTGKVIFQSYSTSNAAGFKLSVTSDKAEVIIGNKTTYSTITGATTITDGNWHYVVACYQSNFVKIFVDGILDGSGYSLTPDYNATNYVRVGCANNTGTDANFFNGAIDDLFLINGFAVDAAWVAAKYAEGTAQTNANITATQYFYVTNVADQLLTVTGGADYVLYNGTISSPYYSKAQSPVGFPTDGFVLNSKQTLTMEGRKAMIRGWDYKVGSGTNGMDGGTVTFGQAFSSLPILILSPSGQSASVPTTSGAGQATGWFTLESQSKTATNFSFYYTRNQKQGNTDPGLFLNTNYYMFDWLAIGKI